jgi:hypothetical protein
VIIRFLFQKNGNADDIHGRLQAQFTNDIYDIRSVRCWCQFIRQSREDHHDDPRSGRPLIDFIDGKILSRLKRGPFHSASSLAEAVDGSYSTIDCNLWDSLRIQNFHLHRVRHGLTSDLRGRRLEMCRRLLPIVEATEFD